MTFNDTSNRCDDTAYKLYAGTSVSGIRCKNTSNAGKGVKFYYHHKCSADVREMIISPCMGAERNTNASNDNPLIIWKKVKPKCT